MEVRLLKHAVRIHKWVALLVGLQIFLWIAGGLVMSAIPIDQVRGRHKVTEQLRPDLNPTTLLSLSEVANKADLPALDGAELDVVAGIPVWRVTYFGTDAVFDAKTGAALTPVSEALAHTIADADFAPDAPIIAAELLDTAPAEYSRKAPVWRVRFDDKENSAIYIDPHSAKVTARRSDVWRFYDFFWKLHVMDYDDGANFNHPLLITAAGAALFVALSGLVLLFIKMRRSLLMWRRQRHMTDN